MDKINAIIVMSKDKSYQQRKENIILKPFTHICQNIDGFPTLACHAFNYWLKIPKHKLDLIIEIVEMTYNSILLIDDIQDNSILRGGVPAGHSVYGIPSSINAGIYTLFLPLKKVKLLNHPEGSNVYTEQILDFYLGQQLDIYWRDNFIIPSEMDYDLMAQQKTGGFFTLCLRLMQLFSENKKDFSKFIIILSLYTQIVNDYNNLCSQKNANDKSFADDLTEGKFSFPIIHALSTLKENEEIKDILRQRTRDIELKKYFIGLLEKSGSLAYTTDVLDSLEKLAQEEIDELEPNALMKDYFKKLVL